MPSNGNNKKNKEYEELKDLLKENLELNKQMHEMIKSIKTYILVQRIWFGVKILIILVPLILGIIYLPPLIEKQMNKYEDLMGFAGARDQVQTFLQSGSRGGDLDLKRVLNNLTPSQKEELKQKLVQ